MAAGRPGSGVHIHSGRSGFKGLSLSVWRRSQFLIVRLGRCLKLIASTRGTFCHEFASQFGKKPQTTVDRPAAVDRRSVADRQLNLNGRNPFSPRSSVPRGQRENAAITVQTPCREQYFFHFYCLRLTRLTLNKSYKYN